MIEQYSNPLMNMCYIYLRDREVAEDDLRETFLKVCRTRSTFRGDSHEKTWLTRIAINICRDMRRSAWFIHVNRTVTPDELPLTASDGFQQEDRQHGPGKSVSQPPRELKRGGAFTQARHLGAQSIVPPEGCMIFANACRIALPAGDLEYTEVFVAFCCMDGETTIWKVVIHMLCPEDMNSGRFTATWMVELECMTGEVRNVTE